jgi:ubiquinol-cytochrome c reductase cytochrome c subunit
MSAGRRTRSGLPWILGAIAAAGLAQALLAPTSRAALEATAAQLAEGRGLFEQSCASCHGPTGAGTADGPSLARAGPANVDFMLSTGRMPLANPGMQPRRQAPAFTPEQIQAIIAYVGSFSSGGTAIPRIDVAAGSVSLGQQAYGANCAACHGSTGSGDSIGGNQIAPSLGAATPLQIAEAVRVGPGPMPRFGQTTVDDPTLDSMLRYLLYLRAVPNRGGLGLTRVGPVAEGFVGVVIGLGLLLLAIRLAGTRT